MVETYTKLDSITHIHKRPDMYIGSIKTKKEESEILYDKEMKTVENIFINDGFVRIFLEALSNAIDNFYRSSEMKMTKIMRQDLQVYIMMGIIYQYEFMKRKTYMCLN